MRGSYTTYYFTSQSQWVNLYIRSTYACLSRILPSQPQYYVRIQKTSLMKIDFYHRLRSGRAQSTSIRLAQQNPINSTTSCTYSRVMSRMGPFQIVSNSCNFTVQCSRMNRSSDLRVRRKRTRYTESRGVGANHLPRLCSPRCYDQDWWSRWIDTM
jgi:hypothetical protein